jgi:hypothetical protein
VLRPALNRTPSYPVKCARSPAAGLTAGYRSQHQGNNFQRNQVKSFTVLHPAVIFASEESLMEDFHDNGISSESDFAFGLLLMRHVSIVPP